MNKGVKAILQFVEFLTIIVTGSLYFTFTMGAMPVASSPVASLFLGVLVTNGGFVFFGAWCAWLVMRVAKNDTEEKKD